MKEQINILITCAGGSSALNCIKSLKEQTEIPLKIVGVDNDPFAAGLFKSDTYYNIPAINSPNYLDAILEVCSKEKISVLFPMLSTEIILFSSKGKTLTKKGIRCLVSPVETVRLFQNKWRAFKFLKSINIQTPETWLAGKYPIKLSFPIFVKPIIGSGSRQSFKVNSYEELNYISNTLSLKKHLIQNYIDGQEYTVDAVAGYNGSLISAVPRERIKTRNGMAIVSKTVEFPELIHTLETISQKMKFKGPLNMQFIVNDDGIFVTDINTRFSAGGLPLSIKAGIDIPLIVLKLCIGMPVQQIKKYEVDLLMIRYYDELFINGYSQTTTRGSLL